MQNIPVEKLRTMAENIVDLNNYKFDSDLLVAIVLVESGGDPLAVRYESNYHWLVGNPGALQPETSTDETEITCQKMSWGLAQIMGATARDLGFRGWLTGLLDPNKNLLTAGILMRRLWNRYQDADKMVASYNAGSPRFTALGKFENQEYVDKVNAEFEKLKKIDTGEN